MFRAKEKFHTDQTLVCQECGHKLEDHAQGGHRTKWFCEHANCVCSDFRVRPESFFSKWERIIKGIQF